MSDRTTEPVTCKHCGTIMADAGGGIGLYCPAKACPGDAIMAAEAQKMAEDNAIRQATELLRSNGYSVERSPHGAGTKLETPAGHDAAQARIAACVREIQIIADTFGYDPLQWLMPDLEELDDGAVPMQDFKAAGINVMPAPERRTMPMKVTDEMVSRFLSWKLPENFCPDAGISFKPEYNVEYNAARGLPPARHEPTGTNLFDHGQAKAMLECVLASSPEPSAEPAKGSKAWHEIQGLRGMNARRSIEMDIIERLLDGTSDDDLTSIDMEYWLPIHDRIRALLRKSPGEPCGEFCCPNCEKNEVGTFRADQWFLYGKEQYRLLAADVEFFRCMACGCEFTGEDGEQKRNQAVREHLARLASTKDGAQ